MKMPSDEALRLLSGAIDMHVHTNPGRIKRGLNDFDLAEQLLQYQMKGAVIKDHHCHTADRAWLVNHKLSCNVLYGAITLNHDVGGVNPYAVETAIACGAKVVWMPTLDAENHIRNFKKIHSNHTQIASPIEPRMPLKIIDGQGMLIKEAKEVLEVVHANDICVATGHVSNEEAFALIDFAKKIGIKKIQWTHPDFLTSNLSLSEQRSLVSRNIYLEKTFYSVIWGGDINLQIVKSVFELDSKFCVISSDFGQPENPDPILGLANFVDFLLVKELHYSTIEQMLVKNTQYLLNI